MNGGGGQSDTVLKGNHRRTTLAKFGLISVGSEGEALNVIICIIKVNINCAKDKKFSEKPGVYVELHKVLNIMQLKFKSELIWTDL